MSFSSLLKSNFLSRWLFVTPVHTQKETPKPVTMQVPLGLNTYLFFFFFGCKIHWKRGGKPHYTSFSKDTHWDPNQVFC